MAYVLGFFSADGYITINKRGGHFWSIQIKDKDLLEEIKKVIGSDHKIGFKKENGNNKAIYRLQIGSLDMCNDLNKLGFKERKTKNLSVPKIPNKYFKDFVRGYFDGDGNIWTGYVHKERKNKLFVARTTFTSCSLDFLCKLKDRLNEFNIDKGVIGVGKGGYYRLTYSIHGSLKLYNFMYNSLESRLFLNRKKVIFEEFVKMRP